MFRSIPIPTLDPPVQSQFTVVYNTLPDSVKRALLEDHLLPLIDALPSASKRTLLSTAHALQARCIQLPPLSLLSKKAEINALLEELRLDLYRTPASSRREEISEELVDSIVDWLSDIWQTVYEVGVEFERGHECLLYCCEVLQQIAVTGSGCKCSFMNVYVSASIRNRSGVVVKEFSYSNVYLLEDAFLWIWRDMLLRILADGRKSELEAVPRMLRDIQSATREWETALDRLLVSGRKFRFNDNEGLVDDDCDDYDDEFFSSCCPFTESKYCHHCPNNAEHWPPSIHNQLPNLRTYISTVLCVTFTLHPSLSLYTTILSLTPISRSSLLEHLRSTTPYSATAATAALDIHAYDKDPTSLLATLAAARPVLRARDAPALQRAARFLMETPEHAHFQTACDIVQRELRACVNTIRGAVLSRGFGGLENAQGMALWGAVGRSPVGSAQRKEAVARWVDAVVTAGQPGVVPAPTLNFAALLVGFPISFDPDDADPDPFLFSTIKEGHPDYEDLIEEWRPRLKERFEGWKRLAEGLKKLGKHEGNGRGVGVELMRRVVAEMMERMPWIGEGDVVHEMIGRIQDKPTNHHICDALESLVMFVMEQKKREQNVERLRKMAMNLKVRQAATDSAQRAGESNESKNLNEASNPHGAWSSSETPGSPGGSPHTAFKKMSAAESMKEFLQEVHEKPGNLGRLWGPRGRGAPTSGVGTQPMGGRSASGAAHAMRNKTEGKEKGKEKEKEEQPYSFAFTSRYTAKEKGKGKALYPVASSAEEESEIGPVWNDNTESPAYPHASGDHLDEGPFGQRDGLDVGSLPQSQLQTTPLGSGSGPVSCWSQSDTSQPELEPIDMLD